jgi:excisionase family DNA binding protein
LIDDEKKKGLLMNEATAANNDRAFCPDGSAGTEPEYYTPRQLAGKVNVSLKAIVKWTAARRLPCCKMGHVWRYPRREIEKRLLSGSLLYDKR